MKTATRIYAHRGSKGNRPENTLAAFEEAVRLGADGIELDVHLSKDGGLAVIHDETLSRTTNGTGFVKDFTMEELRLLEAGAWFSEDLRGERIPSLEQVCSLLQGTGMILNIEIKNDVFPYEGIEKKVLAAIADGYDKNLVILSSFNHYTIRKLHELDPETETAILFMEGLYEPWNYAKTVFASALHVYEPLAFSPLVDLAKSKNYPVRVFTVNDETRMEALMKKNVDAIMTDYPERALEIRNRLL